MRLSTKVFVCLVGVLGNAGIWGDISIETVLAQTNGYSNKKSESKSCARPCKIGQKPKSCVFNFRAEATILGGRKVLAINGQVPGPAIQVCVNDIVVVDVSNNLPGMELAVHWHGMSQRGSPFMDGVPMITQCPISSGTHYSYAFRADQVGTHFYHAHSVFQQLMGLVGALVVRQPQALEAAGALHVHEREREREHEQERGVEHVLLVGAGAPDSAHAPLAPLAPGVLADRIHIDGYHGLNGYKSIEVTGGQRYRIRVINAIPLDCPVIVSIAEHLMLVIASDGKPVKPMETDRFLLFPGERFDFILNANQQPSTYTLKVKGTAYCNGLFQKAVLIYDGINITKRNSFTNKGNSILETEHLTTFSGQHMSSVSGPPADLTVSPVAQRTVYLRVDSNDLEIDDTDSEYRYLSDAMPVPPFYPAELSLEGRTTTKVTQINNKNFLYPNAPILSQPEDIIERTICKVDQEYRTAGVECVQVLEVEYKSTLELVIVDEGFGSGFVKTFHMHGNPMYVLAISESSDKGISLEYVQQQDANGQIKRNILNPPQKDTIMVPNKGYVIVRMVADNPGSWLFECRACGPLPAAIVINVKSELPAKIKNTLPTCANFKPADTLLN